MAMLKPTRPKQITKETVPDRAPEKYQGVEVETKYTDTRPLSLYIEGQQWFVDYYKQVLNDHDEGNPLSTGTPGALQQYRKIKNVEFKLTSPLSGSFEAGPNEWTMTGTANLYPSLVPNKGDMFVADIGDGHSGIFTVEQVSEKSIYKDTAYEIEFFLAFEYNQEGHGRDLEAKVIETLYFEKDRLLYGENPMVVEKKHFSDIDLRKWENLLFETLYQEFIDNQEMTWRVPIEGVRLYDHGYARMMATLFDTDSLLMRTVRLLNIGVPNHQQIKTFWDALLERDMRYLSLVDRQWHITHRGDLYAVAVLNSAFFSTFNCYVLPMRFITQHLQLNLTAEAVVKDLAYFVKCEDKVITEKQQPLIYPANIDNNYVLSDNFYRGQGNYSILELLTKEYMEGKPVQLDKLHQLLDSCLAWNRLDKFYYYPILVILIRAAISGESVC